MFHPNLPNIPSAVLCLFKSKPEQLPTSDTNTIIHGGENCGGEILLPYTPQRLCERKTYRGFCANCKRRVSHSLQKALLEHFRSPIEMPPFNILPSLRSSPGAYATWIETKNVFMKTEEVEAAGWMKPLRCAYFRVVNLQGAAPIAQPGLDPEFLGYRLSIIRKAIQRDPNGELRFRHPQTGNAFSVPKSRVSYIGNPLLQILDDDRLFLPDPFDFEIRLSHLAEELIEEFYSEF